jgi:hypothetical protein
LISGATVTGTMKFTEKGADLYTIHGVVVSGSHIVYEGQENKQNPIHVQDHPAAKQNNTEQDKPTELYCLITSDNRIPVVSDKGILEFADWEELTSFSDLQKWHKQVFETLNKGVGYDNQNNQSKPTSEVLYSESVFSDNILVKTETGYKYMKDIRVGDILVDEHGSPMRVKGTVIVSRSEVEQAFSAGNNAYISSAAWLYENGAWIQPNTVRNLKIGYPDQSVTWHSLFTESGTFMIRIGEDEKSVRDFTDIGSERIRDTYNWVLQSLKAKAKANANA